MDHYYLKNNKCEPCHESCEGTCKGEGAINCDACKAIGWVADAVLGCKSCDLVLPNCLKCASGTCEGCKVGFYDHLS